MKITDILTHVVAIPSMPDVQVRRNWVFVEIRTDEGVTGLGEATTEWHELAVKTQIDSELKPRLLGMDPTDIERIWQLGYRDFWWRRGVVHSSALSGIDQALWDIAGKAAGKPVFKMLGGKVREQVRLYTRTGDYPAKTPAQAARAAIDDGFDAIKSAAWEVAEPFDDLGQAMREAEHFLALRQEVGPNVDLMIDAGSRYSPQSAYCMVEALAPLKLLFIEEPTSQDTVEPTLRLKHEFPDQRIALGERMITRWDFRPWFEKQAIDVCQADISHTGGISELMRIAHYAEMFGITIAPHNPYGPVALAASAHAAAAMQNFLILEHCRLQPWFDQIQTLSVPIHNGAVDVLELEKRPGLGVELDMDFVRAHAGHISMSARRYVMRDGSTPVL